MRSWAGFLSLHPLNTFCQPALDRLFQHLNVFSALRSIFTPPWAEFGSFLCKGRDLAMLWAVAAVSGSSGEQHRVEGAALAPTSLQSEPLDVASAADVSAATDSSNASSWLASKIRKQPHIVVYMADDLGFEDTGFGGSSIIQTPFLDGLAAEAVQLTSFRTSAWCAPARSAFLTGRHEWELGTYFTDEVTLMGEAVLLSELLHDLGYHTAIAGKWPNPNPKPNPTVPLTPTLFQAEP